MLCFLSNNFINTVFVSTTRCRQITHNGHGLKAAHSALPQQLTIYNNSEEAVEERLKTLVACGDYLVKHLKKPKNKRLQPLRTRRVDKRDKERPAAWPSHHNQQVGVGAREHGDVHGHVDGVGLIQAHAEVPLPAQQQQNEHADVHESNAGCREATAPG